MILPPRLLTRPTLCVDRVSDDGPSGVSERRWRARSSLSELLEAAGRHEEAAKLRGEQAALIRLRAEVAGGTVRRNAPRVGRNDPCPCGSGKKHKKCCLQASDSAQARA